ncbi:ATP-cone domain-containing protein [Hippea maritima]|uniref:ATP-cone domain protein n=1 Tax=Hippea maritima (strain ATCC 700847 / DSM 10411 / MH2) TaxID=760142 RepID=F2LXC0_HIPMA|nr:ATP-cone domain-containing protein [Hippea maritima]AEA34234.1 ATP-cone domain protein [Hippea maritima DSM 10411]
MKVIKSNGEIEDFRADKLINSLIRSGASIEEAQEITNIIQLKITKPTPTRTIYRLAKNLLKRTNISSSMKYSLKKAMMRLGPSGYPFERFFAKIMQAYGFETEVDIVEEGRCINHEIDVLAFNKNTVVSVECKYHSSAFRASDAKVAMYVYSRFKDLEDKLKKKYHKKRYEGWLVTNTRLTIDAIKFSRCYSFKAMGWRYPEDGGLEKLIEKKKLYPITVLSIKQDSLQKLLKHELVMATDIIRISNEFLENLGLNQRKINQLKKQARALLG